ncbi:hypothetical protein PENSPDRAFT_695450 [Peniophora sp. CONT]|nr:hypothetical protein PENSPDRAFT_695450 [Peniophora sp. CONT]
MVYSSELSDGPIEPAATDAAPARRPIISDELVDKVLGITEMNRKEAERENGKGKGKEKGKGKVPGKGKEKARKPKKCAKANSSSSGSEGEVEVVDEVAEVDPGGEVVASLTFHASPCLQQEESNATGLAVELTSSRAHRTSLHSSTSAQTFIVPPEANPASASNWSRHLRHDCKKFPPSLMYETWLEQHEAGEGEPQTMGCTGSLQSWVVKNSVAVEQAKKQPLTRRRWREVFVKGLIEDDLPFTFGEKSGMRKVFATILPKGYKVPDRKMVRRDLDTLHAAMVSKRVKPDFADSFLRPVTRGEIEGVSQGTGRIRLN